MVRQTVRMACSAPTSSRKGVGVAAAFPDIRTRRRQGAPPSQRRHTRALFIAIALTIGMTGCGVLGDAIVAEPAEFTTPTTIAGAPDAPVVLQIGDSITQFSQDQLATTFTGRGWSNAVVGHTGTRISENRGRILGAVEQDPDVLVIQLGTNDALSADAPLEVSSPSQRDDRLDESIAQMRGALDDVAGVSCVVWVDLNDWTDTPLLRVRDTAPRLNDELAAAKGSRPWLHIAPYAAFFRPSNPQTTDFLDRNFDPERLHPVSVEARRRYADIVASTVADSCNI